MKRESDKQRKAASRSVSIQSQILEDVNSMSNNFNTSMTTQISLLKELIATNKASSIPQPISSTDWTPSSQNTPQSYLHTKAEKEGKRVVEYPSIVMIANKLNLTSNEEVYFTEDDFKYPLEPFQNKNTPSPLSLSEIVPIKESVPLGSYNDMIVTADLEALITPEGLNIVYMASWYNGNEIRIYDITQFDYDTNTMLIQFWTELIQHNKGRNCYFHNFGGYDSILSLVPLLSLSNYTFSPIMKDGEIMSLNVLDSDRKSIFIILDSIRLLPSSLAKLAKDWKVETQKDHFPHYFFLDNIPSTLNYTGIIPEYNFFERTSLKDYQVMVDEFKNKPCKVTNEFNVWGRAGKVPINLNILSQ